MADGTVQPGQPRHEGEPLSASRRMKRRLYRILEAGKTTDIPSVTFDYGMMTLILANVLAFCAETVPAIEADWAYELAVFDAVSVAIFTVEYLLRIWVCTEHGPLTRFKPWVARWRFVRTPLMVVDLLAILPFYLGFLLPIDLRVLRIFRLLRFLKLARYSPAISSLGRVVYTERRALIAALIIMMGALLVSSTLLYFVEHKVQPDKFGSVPDSMWWAIATLTTVGYGDVVPVTTIGRLIGGIVMILGLGMFALPIGIIATGFSQEIHRREFAVTWGMVARVPLFRDLEAEHIANITSQLEAIVVPRGSVVARAGDEAEGMFFIVGGEVEIETDPEPVSLGEGEFFGEMALLRRTRRQSSIVAVRDSHLLKLSAADFSIMMRQHPELRERVRNVARERVGDEGAFSELDELQEQRHLPPLEEDL